MSNEEQMNALYEAKRRFHNSYEETFGSNQLDIYETLFQDYWSTCIVLVQHIDSEIFMQCAQECDDADWDGEAWKTWYCYRPLVAGPVQQKQSD